MTIYPITKATPQRAVDIIETFSSQMLCINSASDWSESSPSMLTDTLPRIPRPRPRRIRRDRNLLQ